ncbi:zinc finger protein 729-like [Palaemon carinicauda]|uniref:zinc finger protein 729-like n=1 Tax=Palaemon carinicauda TaxID=392227 RepID=UPI0035B5EA0D
MDSKEVTEPSDKLQVPVASTDNDVSNSDKIASTDSTIGEDPKGNDKKEEDDAEVAEETLQASEIISVSEDTRDSPEVQHELSATGESPPSSKTSNSSPNTKIPESSVKKQTVRLHKKHLYSLSLPSHTTGDKKIVPVKKKAPVIIRNISEILAKESDNDDVDAEIKANDNVISEESPLSKTIYISQSPSHEELKENKFLTSTSHSENTITVDRSGPSRFKGNYLTEDSPCKKGTSTSSVGSSQPSPYNTRYAHLKIGAIFSLPNKSSGISRKKIDKDSIKVIKSEQIKYSPGLRCEKSNVEERNDNGVCFLCGIAFGDDMGISLSVKKPLPLSNVDVITLLESFSISCASVKAQNLNFVNICNVCHTLVIEGDSSYKHLLSVASEMREQWPYRAMKSNPLFSLHIPESAVNQFNSADSVSESVASLETQESSPSEYRKVRGRVGRPPKIKIKQEDDDDINWKPSQVKLERTTGTGRRGRPPKRKMKRERRGRPRKVVVKGEASENESFTCGLCSEEFLEESDWGIHYENVHKPQLRWVNYRSQKKLKKLILYNIQESFLNEDFNEITCHACDSKFFEKNAFIEHLRCLHEMIIDEEYINALVKYSQGHTENTDDLFDSDIEKDEKAASDGTIIKIEKDAVPSSEKVEKSLKCKVCHLTLKSEQALKEHTDTNHFSLVVIGNDDSREIVMPEEKSESGKAESDHENSEHFEVPGKENVDDDEYVCEECEEMFDGRHKLLEHKLNIHGSNDDKGQEKGLVRYECEVCGRRIYGLAALKVHMTKVHYKTVSSFKFSCWMCVYKSQSRSQLGKHMRSKHGKEIMPSVQCETCGKMYGSSYIAKHIATMHSTHSRNFLCNFCDMKFYDMAGLKFHIYHEHANKVWKCNKCPMEFKKYHQLRQHRIFTHSTKVHACMECPKTYKRKSDLTEHVKRLHLQRVVLLCPRCPKQYVNRFKLRNHLMKHHDVPWEDTLARNYARHQRANNCRRTEDGVLEANKDQQLDEDIFIQESYDNFDRQKGMKDVGNSFEEQEHEYHDNFNRHSEEHEYHVQYRQNNDGAIHQHQQKPHHVGPIKMERDDHPEEYIEIMEATDAFAQDGITYVIIEEP